MPNKNDLIADVRQKVEETLKDLDHDPRDWDRLRLNDQYVLRFLEARDGDIDGAVNMIKDTFSFRNKYGVNDITENSFPPEVFEAGVMYNHNHDLEGNIILVFNIRLHQKNSLDEKSQHKFVLFWLEKLFWSHVDDDHELDHNHELDHDHDRLDHYHDRLNHDHDQLDHDHDRLDHDHRHHRLTVLFDMSGAGYSNMDLSLMRFIVNAFKLYYPAFLAYFLVYEMSFIFNAIWEVIKTWLPEKSRGKVKFVKKNTIQQFIGRGQLANHMGGEDDYIYTYRSISTASSYHSLQEETPDTPAIGNGDGELRQRKVKFHESHKENGSVSKEYNGGEDRVDTSREQINPVTIEPNDSLIFTSSGLANLTITNNSTSSNLAYKLRTTSPMKYKVKPVSGVVVGGGATNLNITLITGNHLSVRDKFLVQCVDIGGEKIVDPEVWKSNHVHVHRLHCKSDHPVSTSTSTTENEVLTQLQHIRENQRHITLRLSTIERRLTRIYGLVILITVLILVQCGFLW